MNRKREGNNGKNSFKEKKAKKTGGKSQKFGGPVFPCEDGTGAAPKRRSCKWAEREEPIRS